MEQQEEAEEAEEAEAEEAGMGEGARRRDRVVVHIDVDCMYAQCEQRRLGLREGQPIAVVQKHIVVTANYAARALGVEKLMLVERARRMCAGTPEAVFVDGSDLSAYRCASCRRAPRVEASFRSR